MASAQTPPTTLGPLLEIITSNILREHREHHNHGDKTDSIGRLGRRRAVEGDNSPSLRVHGADPPRHCPVCPPL